ncbi:Retrovirus-related Pol polyprotein from type-1 retrotransposable element R1 [Eumeta japonica]|uniref:Retrovirus-related Pol polyprotein from type-1 retrotransposable element R1 n=1 Tax=Eumeta variegata TaxID=151549 RepID=A0A4C1U2M4_EUMVA|nr:Retrovirus-related Pol polyprotein from type-1 retrotransposable element R1 [Eumeta japonica]
MAHLKYQPMPSPTCPRLLLKIVTALFPRQREFIYTSQQLNPEDIPLVSKEELMEASLELFLDVYNTCLKEGTFPREWKQQRLVLLPKGKKPPEEPSSYRPLCMLDTAGKIFERLIHQRIEAIVDLLLTDNQYGFRKGRSTLDAINLVVNIAKDAIAGTRWKGGYLRRIVASYFTGRVLKYDTKNGPKEYNITGGVPQGSVLGPLLWNIMYDGLLRLNIPRCLKLVAYADDVAVVIVAKHLDETRRLFDITFEQVNRWMDTVNLQLAERKTEAVLITSRKVVKLRV